ncbi:MAG: lysylphosphatidylglycerol synthase transmembrane domain-containing protein [Saprospiraceae bacterium]
MKPYLKIALSLLILVFLGFFVRATDWQGVLRSVQQVGFNFIFLLFVTFVSAWLSVMAWRYCLPKEAGYISAWKFFWIRQIGENIAILNPASVVGGEAMKIYMLGNLGIDKRLALHSILLSRALTILSQLLMLLIAGICFLAITSDHYSWPGYHWLWILLLPAALIQIIVFSRNKAFKGKVHSVLQRLGLLNKYLEIRNYVGELWHELRTFYKENRRSMLLSFVASCLHWIVGSLEFYFILLYLGVKTSIAKALLVDMGVIVFKTAGAFIPGQIGVEEYGNKVMLAIIGIAGNTIWITASILRRARQLFWMALSLIVYIIFFRKTQPDPA